MLGTKAETLAHLAPHLRHARTLPQLILEKPSWKSKREEILRLGSPLAIRSSARAEDTQNASLAGCFQSFLHVQGWEQIEEAIERVFLSYQKYAHPKDQVLIQPMLQPVSMSGVAFLNNSAPYIVINYDNTSGTTDSVTRGTTNQLNTYYAYKYSPPIPHPPLLKQVIDLILELEILLHLPALDIEFAFDSAGTLFLLQARPLIASSLPSLPLAPIADKLKLSMHPHPYLLGRRTIYGIMPDWNPAEIIGIRPKPLALSLYKEIITDSIWAYQRDNYGYRRLRGFPLLHDFGGQPYIDVRVSFNSFIPATLDSSLANRLVNYYLDKLEQEPHLHDKVEFEIVFTCYTFDLKSRIQVLLQHGFTQEEIDTIVHHLRILTREIIDNKTGLWQCDRKKIDQLQELQRAILSSDLDPLSQIYWLLEDCKRYGTLPFAGLARAGFIAIQLLKSLVQEGLFTSEESQAFLESLDTVSSQMSRDFHALQKEPFLAKYGHLRPGTYDILSPRYDEAPEHYFNWESPPPTPPPRHTFALTLAQLTRLEGWLKEHEIQQDVLSFLTFLKGAIEGREYSKFIFTKSVSELLKLIETLGFSRDDCAYLDISFVKSLYASSTPPGPLMERQIAQGRTQYALTQGIHLPPLITSPSDVWAFHLPASQPNYITLLSATAPPAKIDTDFRGKILFIPSADPGYDWIFSRGIAGFITQYGGINSHMAIRAAELSIPAVIGAGELLYNSWAAAKLLSLDCANRMVRVLQ